VIGQALVDARRHGGTSRRVARAWLYEGNSDLEFWCAVAGVRSSFVVRQLDAIGRRR
jgi:hypothetical protein